MSFGNLSKIEKLIDQMISEMNGSENVVIFLELVLDNSSKIKERVSHYITIAVANYFNLSVEELMNEGGRLRDEASYRIICYRLHKDLLKLSIRETARIYKRKENAIFKGLKKIDDIESNPKIDIKIYEGFMKVKEHVTKFYNYLEENKNKDNGKKKN